MNTRDLIEQVKFDAYEMIYELRQRSQVDTSEDCFKYATNHRRDYSSTRDKVQNR